MQAAFEVYNELCPGFPESAYEEGMNRELTRRGIVLERQKEIEVFFKGELIGKFQLDNIANDKVILEYKAVSEIARIHKQQALSYLKVTDLELAIVINFSAGRVQASRVVNTRGKAKLPPSFPNPRLNPPDSK